MIEPADVEVLVDDDPAVAPLEEPLSGRRWWWWLGGISLLGLMIRWAAVLGRTHRLPGGDGYYYYYAAKLLVAGKWFLNPFVYYGPVHGHVQTAEWPPLFVFVMAVPQALGLHSYVGARLWLGIVGCGAIVVVALAAREIGGPRVGRRIGLIAAFLLAIYPNIWMSTELGLSEALSPLLVAWVMLRIYRFWRAPSYRTAAWLGVAFGFSILGRDEFAALFVLGFVPLALLVRSAPWRRRAGFVALAAVITVGILTPWLAYNASRFDKVVFVRDGLGSTLAVSNCDQTFSGRFVGYWSYSCGLATPFDPKADESVQAAQMQAYAVHFLHAHLRQLPQVELDKLGRAFGFFRPAQQIWFDSVVEVRPYHWAMAGLAMYYGLLVLAVGGTVALRRRRIPSFPLWMVGVGVVLSTTLSFGDTRYRTTFEVSLCILSAVCLEWAARAGRARVVAMRGAPAAPESEAIVVTAAELR